MKKVILLLAVILLSTTPIKAEDAGLWDNFGDVNFYTSDEQTAVSDEQFEETVDKVKEKQKKRGLFTPREPKKMKGESFQQSNETEIIKGIKSDTPVLRIPYELKTYTGDIVPIGHYQAEFEKNEAGEIMMKLYQAHYLIAEYPAQETEEDLFDEHINYLTLEDFDEDKVKINYGSMDFNAFAIVEKVQKGSPQ